MVPSNWFLIVAILVASVHSGPVNYSNSSPPSGNSRNLDQTNPVVYRRPSDSRTISSTDVRRHAMQPGDNFENDDADRRSPPGGLGRNRKVGPEIEKRIRDLDQNRSQDATGNQKNKPHGSRRDNWEQHKFPGNSRNSPRDPSKGKSQAKRTEESPKGAISNSPKKTPPVKKETRKDSIQNANQSRSPSNSNKGNSIPKGDPRRSPSNSNKGNSIRKGDPSRSQSNSPARRENLPGVAGAIPGPSGSKPVRNIPVFGLTLANSIDRVKRTNYPLVPTVLVRCIEYLTAFQTTTVYRLGGYQAQQDALINLFKTQNGDVNLLQGSYESPYVTGVLKHFLLSLKDSIFTSSKVKKFHATKSISDESSRLQTLIRLLKSLPETNQATLGALFYHYQEIIKNQRNGMTSYNAYIATGFSRWNRNFPFEVFETLALHADRIFPSKTRIVSRK
jgi:hypothetical protein